jgi:hypothetical protein
MSETIKQKAKRVLKKFDFSKEDHCVSLVGPSLGNAANGFKTLVLKASNPVEETIEVKKALEQITLKLSMEEFLRKFFDMWSDDAEVLTKLLGFETEHEAYVKAKEERESEEEEYDWEAEHTKWLESRVSQFQLMKSMNEGKVENITKSAFNDIVALQQSIETALTEHLNTKEKQMEELELAKSALSAKEAELATQVDLVKSLEAKVTELESQLDVVKAAEEKAKFDEFATQLKGLVAEDKLENVAKAMFEMNKVNADVVAIQIEALKSAKQIADAAANSVTQELTVEQGHNEVKDSDAVELAKSRAAIFKHIK